MSGIFSLMKESSIPYNVFASSYLRERYIESSIGYLSSVNDVITEQVKELYSNILEADNIDKENAAIKDFIVSSNSEIDKLAMNIKSQVQRFSISLSNLCSNIKDKVDGLGSRDVSNYCYTDRYVNYDRTKMLNSDIPQMNPYKIFERDFNFIGQLMQDLPVTSSNKDKLEIVSTVYKNFKNLRIQIFLVKHIRIYLGWNALIKQNARHQLENWFAECLSHLKTISIRSIQLHMPMP